MTTPDPDIGAACKECLDDFFDRYPDPDIHKRTVRALRRLLADGVLLRGKPAGWAAGIVYAVATDGRIPCGVPGFLNADLEKAFGVSMSTVYKRAAQVRRAEVL